MRVSWITGMQGTVFYGRHHRSEDILECLAMLAERNSLAAIHRIKGIKEEIVMDWLLEAANHVEEIEELLLANHHLTRVQLVLRFQINISIFHDRYRRQFPQPFYPFCIST